MSVSKYINMCKALDRVRISSYTCWAAIHTDYFIRISSFPSYFLNRACFEKAQLEFCEMHFFGVFSCLPWRIRNTDQGHGPTRTPKTCIHMDHSRNRVTRGGSRKPLCLLHTRVARTFSTQHPVYMDWTKVPTWRWVCQLNPFVANRQNTGKPKPRPSSHAKFWSKSLDTQAERATFQASDIEYNLCWTPDQINASPCLHDIWTRSQMGITLEKIIRWPSSHC